MHRGTTLTVDDRRGLNVSVQTHCNEEKYFLANGESKSFNGDITCLIFDRPVTLHITYCNGRFLDTEECMPCSTYYDYGILNGADDINAVPSRSGFYVKHTTFDNCGYEVPTGYRTLYK